jgi:hypothetical protein
MADVQDDEVRQRLELQQRAVARCIVEPREEVTARAAPKTGSWAQWETIWTRR